MYAVIEQINFPSFNSFFGIGTMYYTLSIHTVRPYPEKKSYSRAYTFAPNHHFPPGMLYKREKLPSYMSSAVIIVATFATNLKLCKLIYMYILVVVVVPAWHLE